ncbi:VCBS repeat-containing protein [Phaeodactylibacter luteus]|uniref:ASPIC/UnbV domain-containing protein n=2 Tax=Phaeodactylibacter luteus TaxID=1564516 RepID=A0A5C6RZZ4_9BACT|nr:hypothetical protein FRY97_04425 [Phaeodactylibacter luteus]
MMRSLTWIMPLLLLLQACSPTEPGAPERSASPLFALLDSTQTGISFRNDLAYDENFNVYKYRNFYNGGGVAIGDVNNDGLADVYLTSNQGPNRLYLNKGEMQFEDITAQAGVAGQRAWSTGVTMADVNGDGLLDIYVCNSGDVAGDNKENELFINQGGLKFQEMAAEYNLNDKGYSTHASFFDYDKDGDLDVYILNNSFQAIGSFNLRKNERPNRDELGGDKLMRNDGGQFTDVSEQAGIYGSVIGFGLGVTVGDVNNDNWEDIFISNDFFERDYLYINQQNGTFKEDLVNQIKSISGASMGADMADINNDGHQDIFVTEMLPSDYQRLKTVTTFEGWDKYQYNTANGYHHQFTRNVLHLNRGDSSFSEVSRMLGVEASDWSWGALFFDMDNDGYKDLFIANGIYKDLTDQDYLQYVANESVIQSIISDKGVDFKKLIDIIPSNKVPNHAFRNEGGLSFRKYPESGLQDPSFSNGAAYGDLDNDGDLDLIVNNVNMPCFVYENQQSGSNYLKFHLRGTGMNTFAIGSKIRLKHGEHTWVAENQPTRGFQSSMDPAVVLGLGSADEAEVDIIWPDGKVTQLGPVKANQTLTISSETGQPVDLKTEAASAVQQLRQIKNAMAYTHIENRYIDFNRERLVYHGHSNEGPRTATGDLNSDGLADFVIPGPKGMSSMVYFGLQKGGFEPVELSALPADAEHVAAHLFDADGDGDLDLYIASGGVEISEFSALYHDYLLFNDGQGRFGEPVQVFPDDKKLSTLAVASADMDGDGDLDLFVGERIKVGKYGARCSGYLLENDGQGRFQDVSAAYYPAFQDMGMITDAKWADLNSDGRPDLAIVGEFMEVQLLLNDGTQLRKAALSFPSGGLWNRLETVDLDLDGDLDLALGNLGTNSRLRASEAHPLRLYYSDFDQNSFPESILTFNAENGKDYPYALRHNLLKQLRFLQKKYPDFDSFKDQDMEQIFSPEQLASADVQEVQLLSSVLLRNQGEGAFEIAPLPITTQFSPVYAIKSADVNGDGYPDLLTGGNLFKVQPELGRYDASYGQCLINDGKGVFSDRSVELGFSVEGEIRDFQFVDGRVYVFRNNDAVVTYQLNYE